MYFTLNISILKLNKFLIEKFIVHFQVIKYRINFLTIKIFYSETVKKILYFILAYFSFLYITFKL